MRGWSRKCSQFLLNKVTHMHMWTITNFIAKVQEEEVDKAHNLFKAPFLATMAMTYDVTPTFIEFIMTQALMMIFSYYTTKTIQHCSDILQGTMDTTKSCECWLVTMFVPSVWNWQIVVILHSRDSSGWFTSCSWLVGWLSASTVCSDSSIYLLDLWGATEEVMGGQVNCWLPSGLSPG
jgi:hypothetical protein